MTQDKPERAEDIRRWCESLERENALLRDRLVLAQAEAQRNDAECLRLENVVRGLLESAPYALLVVDAEGWIVLANTQAEEMFGYGPGEMLRMSVEKLLPERFHALYRRYRATYLAQPPRILPLDSSYGLAALRSDGSEFPIEIGLSPVLTGQSAQISIAVRDTSARKQAEARLNRSRDQLRKLSARLQSVREEERTQIARAIHDELGQALTGLKMDVVWLQKHLDLDGNTLLEKMQAMSELIDTTIRAVRRISMELRPGILDDIGLAAAVEWQLGEFQNRTGIQTHLVCSQEDMTLDADGTTAAFRIFQETLTNVARHAHATQVEVTLEEDADHLLLCVKDNGRGITDGEINSWTSIGLLGMQERARLQGGEVEFYGSPGKGTSVTVRLPLHKIV